MALDHVTYFRVLISEILQGTTTDGVGRCRLYSNEESLHQCGGKSWYGVGGDCLVSASPRSRVTTNSLLCLVLNA
jgi:hypothetical protein